MVTASENNTFYILLGPPLDTLQSDGACKVDQRRFRGEALVDRLSIVLNLPAVALSNRSLSGYPFGFLLVIAYAAGLALRNPPVTLHVDEVARILLERYVQRTYL